MYSDKNILHLLTVLESIEKIGLYTNGFSNQQSFYDSEDQLQYNAVCHLLLAIGEETGKLDAHLKEEISFIAWEQIAGLGKHIGPEIVFQITQYELLPLKDACLSILKLMKVSQEELAKLTSTGWYKHLNYLNVAP